DALLSILDRTDQRPERYEQALDGLTAVGPTPPADFARRIGPVVARVNALFEAERPRWGATIAGDFALLVAEYVHPGHRRSPHLPTMDSRYGWLQHGISEVLATVHTRRPVRMLALPTDAAGWIDPVVLADRIVAGAGIGDADTATALTRLAPWRRAEA